MWVDVSVDSGPRFAAHVDLAAGVALLPQARAAADARQCAVHWPGRTYHRLLRDPEPVGRGWVRFRLERPDADGARRA